MNENCIYGVADCNCIPQSEAKISKLKRIGVLVSLALASMMITFLSLVGGLTMIHKVADFTEDSGSIVLNCHLYGDGNCGTDAPWHGFVNIAHTTAEIQCARGFRVETINGLDHISCEDVI